MSDKRHLIRLQCYVTKATCNALAIEKGGAENVKVNNFGTKILFCQRKWIPTFDFFDHMLEIVGV